MKRLLSVCLAVCLLAAAIPAVSVAETQYGVVQGGWLRLRAAASFDAATLSSYYTGTTVTITGTSGSWYHVQAPDGRVGYMYGAYLSVGGSGGGGGSGSGYATVWSANGLGVRLRTGPGTGYRVIAVYRVGTNVTILERGSYWSRIQIGGTVGYMMNQFLTGGGIPVPPPSPTGNATIWSANGLGVRLRTGPGKGYSIIGVYSVGTPVTVLEKGAIWDKVMVGSRVGYMMNEFLIYYANNEVTNVTLNNTSPVVGNVLSALTITPAGALVTYSWLVGDVEKGKGSTYTVASDDEGKTIKLKVTGRDGYTGSATSAETAKVVSAKQVTGLAINLDINNESPVVGDTLKVLSVVPAGATVSYVWKIAGATVSTTNSYTVASGDVTKKIEVTVTGTGAYFGSATVETNAVVSTAKIDSVAIYFDGKAVGNTSPNMNDTLTAVPKPQNATANYTWFAGNAATNSWTKVGTGQTFKVTDTNVTVGQQIMVVLEGKGSYTTATELESPPTGPVTKYTRIETVVLENAGAPVYRADGNSTELIATITPAALEGNVTYEWKRGNTIVGGNSKKYMVSPLDVGSQITVTVKGINANGVTGEITSAPSAMVKGLVTDVRIDIDSTGHITANVTPYGATEHMTFVWYCVGKTSDTELIRGVQKDWYNVTLPGDVGKEYYVKVIPDATGWYTCAPGKDKSNTVTAGTPTVTTMAELEAILRNLVITESGGVLSIDLSTLPKEMTCSVDWIGHYQGGNPDKKTENLQYPWTPATYSWVVGEHVLATLDLEDGGHVATWYLEYPPNSGASTADTTTAQGLLDALGLLYTSGSPARLEITKIDPIRYTLPAGMGYSIEWSVTSGGATTSAAGGYIFSPVPDGDVVITATVKVYWGSTPVANKVMTYDSKTGVVPPPVTDPAAYVNGLGIDNTVPGKLKVTGRLPLPTGLEYKFYWDGTQSGIQSQSGTEEYAWSEPGDPADTVTLTAMVVNVADGSYPAVRTMVYDRAIGFHTTSGAPEPAAAMFGLPMFANEPPADGTTLPEFATEPPADGTTPPEFATEPPVYETEPPVIVTEPPFVPTEPPVYATDPPAGMIAPSPDAPAFSIQALSLKVVYNSKSNSLRVRGLPSEEEAGVTFGFRWNVDGHNGYQRNYTLGDDVDLSTIKASVWVDVYQGDSWIDGRELKYAP